MIYPGQIYDVPRQIIKWTFEFTNNGINDVPNAKVNVTAPPNATWVYDYSTKGIFFPTQAGGELALGTLYKNETVRLMVDFEIEDASDNVTITGTVTGDAILTNNEKSSTVNYVAL